MTTVGREGRLRGSVLGFREFRLLWIGQAVSTVGDQIFPVAVTITVLNAGGSATDIGLVLAARWASLVLFAIAGGVWADRLPRTLVMRAADAFRLVALLGLAALPSTPPLWVLALLVFLVGGGEAFFRPAETALLPSILPPDRLRPANALITISYRTASVVGPGLGALVVTLSGGTRSAFVINALTFGVSLVCLTLLHEPPRDARAGVGARRRAARGPRRVRRGGQASLGRWPSSILASLFLMLCIAPETVLLPVIGRETFGTDHVYAASLAVFAAGGIVGGDRGAALAPAAARAWWARSGGCRSRRSRWCCCTARSRGCSTPRTSSPGVGFEPFNVYWQTALQREIPSDKLARVSSLDWMASLALLPVGMALTGPAVQAFGITAVLLLAAAVNVVSTVVALFVPGVLELRTPPRGRPEALPEV